MCGHAGNCLDRYTGVRGNGVRHRGHFGMGVDKASAVGTAISSVQFKVDGTVLGTASYGLSRPDVCAVSPGRPGCPNVGYSYSLNTSTLSVGTHTITVTATDSDTTPDSASSSVTLNVQATPPTVYIDGPAAGSSVSGTVTVIGWAIDNTSAVGTAIRERLLFPASLDGRRPCNVYT